MFRWIHSNLADNPYMANSYFLTEAVRLEDRRLIQRGIRIDKDRKEFEYEGPYTMQKPTADRWSASWRTDDSLRAGPCFPVSVGGPK